MADASQSLYTDPSLAIQAATVPSMLTQTQAEYRQDEEQARKDQGGFFGSIAKAFGKADSVMSNIPGWGIAKKAVWTPLDKIASGMYWAYSNVISQPVSTLLLQAGKADVSGDWGTLFSGNEWSDAYHRAEHISPGQAFENYENTVQASGNGTLLSGFFGDAADDLSPGEKERVSQNMERFLYDTDYWKKKGGWKYTVGSGGIDFMFNVIDPVSGAAVSSVTKSVKGARSIQLVSQEAKYYEGANAFTRGVKAATPFVKPTGVVQGEQGVARTRGPIIDLFAKQQTPEQVTQLPKMQKMFDWMKEDNRTVEEIANHPMWGRGRRINPARYDIAKLAKDTPRENMEQLWRFAMGDATAGKQLAEQAPSLLKKIGQVADNRVLLAGVRMNPEMVATFKSELSGESIPRDPNLLVEPPSPRPTEPGPRQDGWDQRWGPLARQAAVNRMAAHHIANTSPVRILNPAESTTYADALKASEWKAGKMQTLADDYDELINNERYLGTILGQMDDWTPAMSPLYGTMSRLYRGGGLAVRDTENAAQKATLKSAGRAPKARGGNFVMTTVKRGMGAPMTIIHAFGDKTPQGFVNHNAEDARDRVFDMLKQVKGMTPEQRLDLIEVYNKANNKVERSDALTKIHDTVMNHILVNNHRMDPELADALKASIKNGINDKLLQLGGGGKNLPQRFGPAATSQEDIAKLTGAAVDDITDVKPVRSDRVVTDEDGHGIIVTPLAQTQLSQTDILLPIKEIQRLATRTSKSMVSARMAGANAWDAVVKHLDGFDNLWKFATLLRPGFIPRMVSDEVLARMFKFGGMATLLDTGKGVGHFLENRSRQYKAIIGLGSYAPATGKGIASNRAIVALDDETIIAKAKARKLKVAQIKVPPTLRMAYGRISDETDALKEARAELAQAKRNPNADPGYINAIHDRIGSHNDAIGEYHDYISEILRQAEIGQGRRLGDADFTYRIGKTSYRVPQAFSNEWDNPIPRDQISSSNAWKSLFSRGEMLDRQRYLSHTEKTGAYVMINPDQEGHMDAWLDALNKQMRQDPFHRMIANGATDKEALTWLNTTGEGRKYLGNLGYWNRDKEQFVRSVRFMMDKYLADDVLRAKLGKGEVITEKDLRAAFARDEFPTVHGEEIKEVSALGRRETAAHYRDKYMEKAWKMVADVPADILSRNPVYLQIHQAEMQNLIRQQYHFKTTQLGTDAITPKEWEAMNQKADKLARSKMRQVVYDPVNTTGSQALRFVYPFFKPYIDGIDRWAGLVAERPEQLGKFAKIYNAPVAANLVTDSQGNPVDAKGNATVEVLDPATGKMKKETKFVPLSERVLHFKAPWAKPGDKEYSAPIRMQSLNTILPGDPWFDPGTGPIVQLTGNELAKTSPQVGEFLQWSKVLPYGESESAKDLLLPKYMKDAYYAYMGRDPDNQKYQQAVMDIYNMKTAQYYEKLRAGEHVKPPTMKQIQKDAKKFLWLQTLTDWAAPASIKTSPLQGTKYQFFADQYKALQKADPQNARDHFLNMFGDDYLSFTDALTESMGIASTISADKQMEKYRDQIAEDPDLAALWIGDAYNGGPFSSSVYEKQLHDEIGGERVRRRLTAEESIIKGREQEGWRTYRAANNALDAELIRAGFTSYTETGAERFNAAKQQIAAALSQQNQPWAKAFGVTDRNKIPNRIRTMEQMVQDPNLIRDPMRQDIKSLAGYLMVRNQMKQLLAQRGLQQLSFDEANNPSGEAADIGYAWRQYQMYFINKSVGFGNLFHRYLENDDLQ